MPEGERRPWGVLVSIGGQPGFKAEITRVAMDGVALRDSDGHRVVIPHEDIEDGDTVIRDGETGWVIWPPSRAGAPTVNTGLAANEDEGWRRFAPVTVGLLLLAGAAWAIAWSSEAAGYRKGLREAPEVVAAQRERWAEQDARNQECRAQFAATPEGARANLCDSIINSVEEYLWETETANGTF